MTAPDPGLTDLIAAHTLRVVELNEAARYPECNGCDWVGGLAKDHAAHLASVVEQHTNGRICTVAKRLRGDCVVDKESAANWKARAEKAEATIARVKDAVSGLPACDKYEPDDAISCGWKNAVVDVIAALEGEQQ